MKQIVNYKRLIFLGIFMGLYSCNSFDKDTFYKKYSISVSNSVSKVEKENKLLLNHIIEEVAEAGNKPIDIKVSDNAMLYCKKISDIKKMINSCASLKDIEASISLFLDSLYTIHNFKGLENKKYRKEINKIYTMDNTLLVEKKLLLTQFSLMEKDILIYHNNLVGTTSCYFGTSITPTMILDYDTITEGDSLKGNLVLLFNTDFGNKYLIDKIEIKNSKVSFPDYPFSNSFNLIQPANLVFDAKGESKQNWKGKVYLTNTRTFEESCYPIEGSYIIEKPCK